MSKFVKKLKLSALMGTLFLAAAASPTLSASSNPIQARVTHQYRRHAGRRFFANCQKGVPDAGNQTCCPNRSALSSTGVRYLQALCPKLSDSYRNSARAAFHTRVVQQIRIGMRGSDCFLLFLLF
jgi:hypothetical protein